MKELLEQIRHCCTVSDCGNCPFDKNNEKQNCVDMLLSEAADAIEKLEAENERLREAVKPNCAGCDSMHHDNGNCTAVGGFCTAVPAAHCPLIPKLRAENAQLRRERDAAVADFETVCKETEDYRCCSFCKKQFTNCEKGCNPEWRGVQEGKA